MHTLQVSLSRLNEGSKNGFLNRRSPVPTNLGVGVRQFMFNRKEPKASNPGVQPRPFFRQFPRKGSRIKNGQIRGLQSPTTLNINF